jgi:hypothetical protein
MKALRDRAWVVLPDLPGHGRSAAIPGRSIEEYADALVPHLEALRAALPATEIEGSASDPGASASTGATRTEGASDAAAEARGP